MGLLRPEVLLQVFSQIVEVQIDLVVSKVHVRHVKLVLRVVADHGLWLLVYLWQCVYFEVPREGVVALDDSWLSRQDDVPQLDAMLRQAVDKVEVEVGEELWEVMPDDEHHSESRLVELVQACGHLLAWDHVVLQEGEQVDDQLLELKPLLVECVVLNDSTLRLALAWSLRPTSPVLGLAWSL